MTMELARYEADGQEIAITDDDIRYVLARNQNVTNEEIKLFIELCVAQKLNPFIKEAYIIKYGNSPATLVVGKDVFTKRAFRNPRFQGMQAGVIVMGEFNGKVYTKEREGSMVYPHEQLMGGWAKVYVKGYVQPVYDSVSMQEYSTGKSNWASKSGTMIRKTALVHALREAFPEELQGLYDASEMGVATDDEGEPIVPAQAVVIENADGSETTRIPVYDDMQEEYGVPEAPPEYEPTMDEVYAEVREMKRDIDGWQQF